MNIYINIDISKINQRNASTHSNLQLSVHNELILTIFSNIGVWGSEHQMV